MLNSSPLGICMWVAQTAFTPRVAGEPATLISSPGATVSDVTPARCTVFQAPPSISQSSVSPASFPHLERQPHVGIAPEDFRHGSRDFDRCVRLVKSAARVVGKPGEGKKRECSQGENKPHVSLPVDPLAICADSTLKCHPHRAEGVHGMFFLVIVGLVGHVIAAPRF